MNIRAFDDERREKEERKERGERSGTKWVVMGHRGRTQNHERRDITLYIAGI